MNKQLRGNIDNNGNGEVITLDDDREDEPMAEAGVKSASQDLVERLGLCVSDESDDENDDVRLCESLLSKDKKQEA